MVTPATLPEIAPGFFINSWWNFSKDFSRNSSSDLFKNSSRHPSRSTSRICLRDSSKGSYKDVYRDSSWNFSRGSSKIPPEIFQEIPSWISLWFLQECLYWFLQVFFSEKKSGISLWIFLGMPRIPWGISDSISSGIPPVIPARTPSGITPQIQSIFYKEYHMRFLLLFLLEFLQ